MKESCKHKYVPIKTNSVINKSIADPLSYNHSNVKIVVDKTETFYLYCEKCGNVIGGEIK